MMKLSRDEQETHFNQTAQERIDGEWHIYSDDPVWIKKLDSLMVGDSNGIKCVEVESHGGKHYELNMSYLSVILKRRKKTSTAARAKMIDNMGRNGR